MKIPESLKKLILEMGECDMATGGLDDDFE